MELTLDDWQGLAQIAFYVTVSIVTILTFLRARKGLLSTINTEYHKKVIERLDELSKILLDEFDFDSPNHWSKRGTVDKAIEDINKEFIERKEHILKAREFRTGIRSNPDYDRVSRLLTRIKSDPFIPTTIREKATDLLANRARVIIQVHLDQLRKYCDQLAKGEYEGTLEQSKHVIHNRVQDELYNRGCGVSQIEEKVHILRTAIQQYFEQYHP